MTRHRGSGNDAHTSNPLKPLAQSSRDPVVTEQCATMPRPDFDQRSLARKTPTQVVFVDNFLYRRTEGGQNAVSIVPHLGLLSLASILGEAGYAADIFDPKYLFARQRWAAPDDAFMEACAERLLRSAPTAIGFTAYGRSLPFAIGVARRIKKRHPRQVVLLGGPHPTNHSEEILHTFDCFDVVVRYEAEPIIVPLMDALTDEHRLDEIANLTFRRGASVVTTPTGTNLPAMDDLPWPDFHIYPIEALGLSVLPLEVGRGCPFNCTFCSSSHFFQRRYRVKSNQRVLAEMEFVRERYGVETFDLNHDLFGLHRDRVLELCRLIHDHGFRWKCSMRPDSVDQEMLDAMAGAGCTYVYFGVESASPRLQETIQKRLVPDKAVSTILEVCRRGVACTASFITGFPEETVQDQEDTLDMIGQLVLHAPHRVRAQLHVLSPEPGSALATAQGDRIHFDGIDPDIVDVSNPAMIRAAPKVFSVFHHFEAIVPRWRVLLASAFVTNLMNKLGYPLVAHVTHLLFAGKLSEFLRRLLPEHAPPQSAAAGIHAALADGMESLLAELPAELAYLPDVVRFREMVVATNAHSTLSGKTEGPRVEKPDDFDVAEVVACRRFRYDTLAILQAICRAPLANVPAELAAPVPVVYLFFRDRRGVPCLRQLEAGLERNLDDPMLDSAPASVEN